MPASIASLTALKTYAHPRTFRLRWLIVAAGTLVCSQASADGGMGELAEGIGAVVRATMLISQVLPHYSLSNFENDTHHGLGWNLPFEYGTGPLVHELTSCIDWYPGAGSAVGRFSYGVQTIALGDGSLLFYPGAGWFVSQAGAGPRGELQLWWGLAERPDRDRGYRRLWGLELRGAYERNLTTNSNGWDVRIGVHFPIALEFFTGEEL